MLTALPPDADAEAKLLRRKARTTVRTLQRYNGISDPRKLRYGQVIKVPM